MTISNTFVEETLKPKWEKHLNSPEKHIAYDPRKGIEKATFEKEGTKLVSLHNPRRLERFNLPGFGDNLLEEPSLIADFEENGYVCLPNAKPILPHHCLWFKRDKGRNNSPQNGFTTEDLKNISDIVERTNIRCWINMIGGAASYDRYHAQTILDKFPIEAYPVYMDKETGFGYIDYPAGNIVIRGTLEARIKAIEKIIAKYRENFKSWNMTTIKKDNSCADEAIFTLLCMKTDIIFIPRAQEVPETGISDAAGGLEMGGIFSLTSRAEFSKSNYQFLEMALRSVSFPQSSIINKYFSIHPSI